MRQWIRSHLTYANVMATIAVFLVLSGGTAVALSGSNTVFTDDIVNGEVKVTDIGQGAVMTDEIANGQVRAADIGDGEVKSADIANGQVTADDLATNSVRADEIADGQVKSPEIGNGEVQAEDLASGVKPGASGARAWGVVTFTGVLAHSKNVTAVTHPEVGVYCIDPGSGIDATTAVMLVGDSSQGQTDSFSDDVSLAQWRTGAPECSTVGTMEVRTFLGNGEPGSGSSVDFGGFDLQESDQGFAFVIP
jgi:hypothetical protein